MGWLNCLFNIKAPFVLETLTSTRKIHVYGCLPNKRLGNNFRIVLGNVTLNMQNLFTYSSYNNLSTTAKPHAKY